METQPHRSWWDVVIEEQGANQEEKEDNGMDGNDEETDSMPFRQKDAAPTLNLYVLERPELEPPGWTCHACKRFLPEPHPAWLTLEAENCYGLTPRHRSGLGRPSWRVPTRRPDVINVFLCSLECMRSHARTERAS